MRRTLPFLIIFHALTLSAAEPRRLPTGVALDPAFPAHRVGNLPLAIAVAPEGDRIVVMLCGSRDHGLQVIDRTTGEVTQTVAQPSAFIGMAFAPDGTMLFASGGNEDTVYSYRWSDRRLVAAGTIVLRPKPDPKKDGTSYPAGLAISRDGRFLYVAENVGDALAVVDVATAAVVQRLDTGRYPYAVATDARGNVYVSVWSSHEIDVFGPDAAGRLEPRPKLTVGRHPSALLLNGDGTRLFAALPTTDSVAVVETASGKVVKILTDRVSGAPSEGCTPNALALSADERRLFVAEADANAVAVFDVERGALLGRVPVEWYPAALARHGDTIFVANAKGGGTAPNPGRPQPGQKLPKGSRDHVLGQLDGSVMSFPAGLSVERLRALSARVWSANGWRRSPASTAYPLFKHVIYVIKENRTYDQVFGDMPEGDGDPSLVYFPRSVSPNHHALADRFGLFDRFFTNAEVSAQGHNWSIAAYSGDYIEKTIQSTDIGRPYDYEGTNREKLLVDDDDDVASPSTGYLWDLAARKGISYRVYGEFVAPAKDVGAGDKGYVATKHALAGHIDPDYPDFDMKISDQTRVDRWMEEFGQFAATGAMPALQIIRLPNDHTAGAAKDRHTPRAYMADNDLALGRIVAALSRSRFWRDTVLFVVEDDAQNGPDHVDSHRSVLLVISAYNRPGVVHRFVNTTDVMATMEEIFGLRTLSTFDHFGRPMRGLFARTPDLRPYEVLTPAADLKEMNPSTGEGAKESALLDLATVDAADEELFNRVLWRAIKGEGVPYPGTTRMGSPAAAGDEVLCDEM